MNLAGVPLPAAVHADQERYQAYGYSLVWVAVGAEILGCIALRAARRPEVPATLERLRQHGVGLCMVSGDQEAPTRALATELGLTQYVANALPEQKAEIIQRLQQSGKTVCFVGDGINDAIALKQADVSISLRGAATLATDTAQIVLLDQTLTHLGEVFTLAQQLRVNMRHNIWITIASSAATVGAVYFLQFGVMGSLVLYNVGLAAGMMNASLPLLTVSATE
jgi:Cu2+-exporting ATPase